MANVGGVTSGSITVNDPQFTSILPWMIDYAELRIIRDIDFLSTVVAATATLATGTKSVSINDFVTVQEINVITPYTQTVPDLGKRVPLVPVAKFFLDYVYPDATSAGLPGYFAPFNQTTSGSHQTISNILVGPFPDQAYTVEVVGTQRPLPLSGTNTQTFISQNLPDLFVMASLVYMSAYQRNFGKMSDDPAMAVTYEGQYKTLLGPAVIEEARKKFESSGWNSMSPPVAASPSRS
jgi:hypothetical protein